jgi:CelD/BcsL family acetyltransferase involved in cellulose biosynthesis
MRAMVAEDAQSLAPHLAAWDEMAVRTGRPFCSPAWMLSWWREARAGDARLRVTLVLDGDELLGVGPFFAQIGRLGIVEMRLLGAGFSHRIGPLARPGEEEPVACLLAQALAAMRPRPASIVFEGIDGRDPFPDLIAAAWPSRRAPRQRVDAVMSAPAIQLDGSYESWLERRDRRFRKEARRTARRLEEERVTGRLASDPRAIDALFELHHARWSGRGGSHVGEGAQRAIGSAARELAGGRRLDVALLEGPAGPVAAELVLQAGDTAVFWGGGFDPAWARNAPGTQAMLLALRHLAGRGVRSADLGGGAHEYKLRLADRDQPIEWRTLFPIGIRYPLIRARLVPKHIVSALRRHLRRLPPKARRRLRRLRDDRLA